MTSGLEDELGRVVEEAVQRALAAAQLDRPAPYPLHVSVDEAARLCSTSADTIRKLVRSGRLRTLDLEGTKRMLIPTLALLELDPAVSTERAREVFSLDVGVDIDDE